MLRSLDRPNPARITAGMALTGAALIAAGVALPWFSLFAGLRPVSALGTTNGVLLLGASAAVALIGLLTIARDPRWARRALAGVGIGLTAFSAYLVVGMVSVYRDVSSDPLLVAQLGPGLVLVVIGSLAIVVTAFVRE